MKKRRFLAIMVAVAFFIAAVFCAVFLGVSADHDCTGAEDCLTCTEIRLCQDLLRDFSAASVSATAALTLFLLFACVKTLIFSHAPEYAATPVALKTRIND